MVATSDKFWERFNGAINFGTTFSKGNESTQYSLGSQTAYVRERWSAQANFDSNLTSSTGANTSTRNSVVTSAYHLLPSNNWFYAGLGNFLQSSEQGISFQSTLGGGVGRYLKNTNTTSISLIGGAAWQNTKYQQPATTQNGLSALIYGDLRFFRFSKTNLDITAGFLPVPLRPRSCSLRYERHLLRQAIQQPEMECLVLWELGQPPAQWSLRQ